MKLTERKLSLSPDKPEPDFIILKYRSAETETALKKWKIKGCQEHDELRRVEK